MNSQLTHFCSQQVLCLPDVWQQRSRFQLPVVRQLLALRPLPLTVPVRRLRGRLRRRRTHHTMHHLVIITIIKLPLHYMNFSVCFWKSQPSFQSFKNRGVAKAQLVRALYRSSGGSRFKSHFEIVLLLLSSTN